MSYQYLLAPRGDGFAIVHVEASVHLGYIEPYETKYRVRHDQIVDDEWDDVAIVNSIDEAIPALLTYYEKHPRWEHLKATEYTKLTPFGLLLVEQNQFGSWSAYRYYTDCYRPLLRDGKPAIFATVEEAQRAADAHLRDDYPNAEATGDGLSWSIE